MRDHEDTLASLDDPRRVPGLGVVFRDYISRPSAKTRRRWEREAEGNPAHIMALLDLDLHRS